MLRRWWSPLGAGLAFLLLLVVLAWLHSAVKTSPLSDIISRQLSNPIIRRFALLLFLREVLPLFLLVSLLGWVLALAWAQLPFTLGKTWREQWAGLDGFVLTFGLLSLMHLALWWRVPSTLWLIPGLDRLPFWLDFAILGPLCLVPLVVVARRSKRTGKQQVLTVAGWLALAWFLALAPLEMSHGVAKQSQANDRKPKMLLVGLDGLRADIPQVERLRGTRFEHAFTAIPSTRLLFSILWGGDPQHYSVGHVFPDIQELNGQYPLALLDAAAQKGLKTRFYIDDGGTIGLAGRTEAFDEVLMPARGWENFVNSNLSGHLPLYASYLDLLRVFPSTHPWASPDTGLRQALESGRGSDLVMFHSCLAHIPSFLTRHELAQIPRWWTLRPKDLIPLFSLGEVDEKTAANWDSRRDPYGLYQIRMKSILEAWIPIWDALASDPDYKDSVRVFFSDHGERFFHATENIRLGGVHGFDVDPWQARVPLVVAGPGFKDEVLRDRAASLLNVRNALGNLLLHGKSPEPDSFLAHPFAAIRYHTLDTSQMRTTDKQYFELSAENIVTRLQIGRNGLWVMDYDRPAEARAKEVTLAQAFGDRLIVFKPLLKGGAHRLEYKGYQLTSEQELDQKAFEIKKAEIEKEYFKLWDSDALR